MRLPCTDRELAWLLTALTLCASGAGILAALLRGDR